MFKCDVTQSRLRSKYCVSASAWWGLCTQRLAGSPGNAASRWKEWEERATCMAFQILVSLPVINQAGSLCGWLFSLFGRDQEQTDSAIRFALRLNAVTWDKNILEVGIILSWSVIKKKKLANKEKKIKSEGGFCAGWGTQFFFPLIFVWKVPE